MARVHMRGVQGDGEIDLRGSLCRMIGVEVVDDATKVTCRLCRRELEPAKVKPKAAKAATDAPAAPTLELPFEPGPPRVLPFGTWKLDEGGVARDSITASIAGEDLRDGPRWGSLDKAFEQFVRVRDDGSPIRSPSLEPFVQGTTKTGGFGGREDIIAIERALDQAFLGPRTFGHAVVSVERCRMVLELRLGGERRIEHVAPGRKGTVARRYPVSAEQLAVMLTKLIGETITEHNIAQIVKEGRTRMRRSLERAGMLRAPQLRPRETTKEGEMPKAPKGWDLDTWVEIADVVGLHEDTCRKLAKRAADPLPVSDYFGRIVAKRADLENWMGRQVKSRTSAA